MTYVVITQINHNAVSRWPCATKQEAERVKRLQAEKYPKAISIRIEERK